MRDFKKYGIFGYQPPTLFDCFSDVSVALNEETIYLMLLVVHCTIVVAPCL